MKSTDTLKESDLRMVLDRTERHLEQEDLKGWDPYDGLCSPLFRLPVLRSSRIIRFGSQQLLKRAPWNLRPILRIEKQLNPVAIALYMQGQAQRAAGDPDSFQSRQQTVRQAMDGLLATVSRGYSGSCWGYPFDWEARYASIPAGTPTVVATGMVTNALWTVYSTFGLDEARALILDAAGFVLNDLNRTERNDGSFCWSYSPLDRQAVLNATLKGSRLLAQAHALGGPSSWLEPASRSVRFALSHQRPTGAWPYAVGDRRTWADNFHTGYVLECLKAYREHSGDIAVEGAIAKGWRYYRARLFAEDLTPKYYDVRAGPLDATGCAQAIITLCEFGDEAAGAKAAERAIGALAQADGSFAYQRRGNRIRRTSFLRWSTAWMYCALSRLQSATGVLRATGPRGTLHEPSDPPSGEMSSAIHTEQAAQG